MKKIAENDNDIAVVIDNLSQDEKIERVKRLYPSVDEVLEILGYYDDSMDKEDKTKLKDVEYDSADMERIAYLMAINNGNFETEIAFNTRF